MTLFTRRADDSRRDRMIQCLMATPPDERRFMLMSAFQTGELRLSEADEVLHMVRRLEETGGGSGFDLWLAPVEPATVEPATVEPAPVEPAPVEPTPAGPPSATAEFAATELAATWLAAAELAATELAATAATELAATAATELAATAATELAATAEPAEEAEQAEPSKAELPHFAYIADPSDGESDELLEAAS